jgi:hypothetical protein
MSDPTKKQSLVRLVSYSIHANYGASIFTYTRRNTQNPDHLRGPCSECCCTRDGIGMGSDLALKKIRWIPSVLGTAVSQLLNKSWLVGGGGGACVRSSSNTWDRILKIFRLGMFGTRGAGWGASWELGAVAKKTVTCWKAWFCSTRYSKLASISRSFLHHHLGPSVATVGW